jgi:hypothetical protein
MKQHSAISSSPPPTPPNIFALHSILLELRTTSESRSFDQAYLLFQSLRISKYQYYHRRHLIYHTLIQILNQDDNRMQLLETYVKDFNHPENDSYRFEPLFLEEMFLRNYELLVQLQTLASLRKNDGMKYIIQICNDNVINYLLANAYISAVSFMQAEYSRFIMNINILFDYTKVMTDLQVPVGVDRNEGTGANTIPGVTVPVAHTTHSSVMTATGTGVLSAAVTATTQRQTLEDVIVDYDIGDGKKGSKPKPAGSTANKPGKDGSTLTFTPYRSPIPADECLPSSVDDWKPFLPDITIITAMNSCVQYISNNTTSITGVAAATTGTDKKSKPDKATTTNTDKTKKGAIAASASAASGVSVNSNNPYAINYNNASLQDKVKNILKKVEMVITATWGKNNFSISRVLYNGNESLCQRIEQTIWVSLAGYQYLYIDVYKCINRCI